ncbi:hypothetical protein ACHAXS_009279 [Conticribra weissflogii]
MAEISGMNTLVPLEAKHLQQLPECRDSSKTTNGNITIFDDAVAIIESSPRQEQGLPCGETMSYREFHKGKPHILVILPGFLADDTMAAILAVLPQFEDHHIIAVNPIGWNGSTMNKPVYTHEENAEKVMELLKAIGLQSKFMVLGYSTGGGIAFYLAQKYPDSVSAAFLMHSIPFNGMKYIKANGEPLHLQSLEDAKEKLSICVPADMNVENPDKIYELFKSFSANPDGYLPRDHKLCKYLKAATVNMPGSVEAAIANVSFNVTPLKTSVAEPSDILSTLKSKVIVIHGSKDYLIHAKVVESITTLAIADGWAPPGMLSFYDDDEGHTVMIDNPTSFARVYRKALEEQVLT